MDAVLNTDTPVIVCNFTGSAMNLSLADEKAAAVIQAWYPGAQGGAALAKILFGEVSPSGNFQLHSIKVLIHYQRLRIILCEAGHIDILRRNHSIHLDTD